MVLTQAQGKVKKLGGGRFCFYQGQKLGGQWPLPIPATILPILVVFKLKTKLTFKRTFCTANLLVFGPASTKDQRLKTKRSNKLEINFLQYKKYVLQYHGLRTH